MARAFVRYAAFSLLVIGVAAACNSRPRGERSRQTASAERGPGASGPKSQAKPEIKKHPGKGVPVEQFIQENIEHGETEGVRTLVYVGATWCEPCQAFHRALEAGELDRELAGTRFLEFDSDRDGPELSRAGYGSKYIPLFVMPDPDGRASTRRLEGSVKGPKALRENLVPRLLALLDGKEVK
jgi:hypothetical protein